VSKIKTKRQTADPKPALRKQVRPESPAFQLTWKRRIVELKAFKKEHGHCDVPRNYAPNPQLATWTDNVRRRKKQGKLTREMIGELKDIGFRWTLLHRRFHRRDLDELVAILKAFKKRHGHCDFSLHVGADPDLVTWLKDVRKSKKFGRLDPVYVKELDRLGFIWRPREEFSEKMFAALLAYRKRYGDCRVPFKWPKNPALASWVSRMRAGKKHGKLPSDQIERLDKIGFPWVLDNWDERLKELKKFKSKHRHCNVPYNYKPNLPLAHWVSNIRGKKKEGMLPKERVRLLNELGFCWTITKGSKMKTNNRKKSSGRKRK
jgi:hypothetical protein